MNFLGLRDMWATALSVSSIFQHPMSAAIPSELTSAAQELPGGSPFRLCDASGPMDLFDISSVQITKSPIYIDDGLFVHLYGSFRETFTGNATITMSAGIRHEVPADGHHPSLLPSEDSDWDFCEFTEIEQPLGARNATCPPEPGPGLMTSFLVAHSFFLGTPAWYEFTFDAKTPQGDRIYCLTTVVCLRYEDDKRNEGYPAGPWHDCQYPR
ncbi:hypothetical protein GGR57DRAFT_496918 [Xylariaceae sp. FL1272]|nr:hypothetical protein GGR57DRAFT_496918 [Xylariaceae sp. FL1272]